MAYTVDGLAVYQKALLATHALSAMLQAEGRGSDRDLAHQLNRASIRVVSDIAEGFEQKTGRRFAQFLVNARGSTREIRTQLLLAVERGMANTGEADALARQFEEVARMLTGLIKHLHKEDRKDRRTGARPKTQDPRPLTLDPRPTTKGLKTED